MYPPQDACLFLTVLVLEVDLPRCIPQNPFCRITPGGAGGILPQPTVGGELASALFRSPVSLLLASAAWEFTLPAAALGYVFPVLHFGLPGWTCYILMPGSFCMYRILTFHLKALLVFWGGCCLH